MRLGSGTFLTHCLLSFLSNTWAFAPLAASFITPKRTENSTPSRVWNSNDEIDADDDSLIFTITPEQRQILLSSHPEEFASDPSFRELVEQIRGAFDSEGVVVIRGLFDEEQLERLEKDSQAIVEKTTDIPTELFVNLKFGPVFSDTALREAALSSAIPKFIAVALLDMVNKDKDNEDADAAPSSLHLLKDAFLAKGGEKKCCGWHVDDATFWPTSAASKPGVNAWIAVDDIPASRGGGLGVSPGSHKAPWRQRAYKAIGSTQMYLTGELDPNTPSIPQTCNMETLDPELAHTIDGTQKVFDYQRGDILFHTRWLFHRSMPITSEGEEYFKKIGKDPTFKRYSIRYDYGDTTLLDGLSIEFAALLNNDNKGKTLAEITTNDGPFYPKCWPESTGEIDEIDRLVAEKFPVAQNMLKGFFAKMVAKK